MITLLAAVGSLFSFRLRSRASLELELVALRHLCLPITISGNIDDEVRRGSAEQRVDRAVGPADGTEYP